MTRTAIKATILLLCSCSPVVQNVTKTRTGWAYILSDGTYLYTTDSIPKGAKVKPQH